MKEIDQQISKNGLEKISELKWKMEYYINNYVIDADINSEEATKQGLHLELNNVLNRLNPCDERQMAVVRLLNKRLEDSNSISLFTNQNIKGGAASSKYLLFKENSFSITVVNNNSNNIALMIHEIVHGCGNYGGVSEEVRDDILKWVSKTEVNIFLKGLLKMKPEIQIIEVLPHLIQEFFSRLPRDKDAEELTTFFPNAIESMEENRKSIFSSGEKNNLKDIKEWSRFIFNRNATKEDFDKLAKMDRIHSTKTIILFEFENELQKYLGITSSSKMQIGHYAQLCLHEPNLLTESTTFKDSSGSILPSIVGGGLLIIDPYIFARKNADGIFVYEPGLDLFLEKVGQLHKDISEKEVSNLRHTYLTIAVERLGESKSETLLQNFKALIEAGYSPYHPDGAGRIPAEMIKALKNDPNKAHLSAQIKRMEEAVDAWVEDITLTIDRYIFGRRNDDETLVYEPGLDLFLKEVRQLHKDISEREVSRGKHTYLTSAVERLGESESEILLQNFKALIKAGCSPYYPDGAGRIPDKMIQELKKDLNKTHLLPQIKQIEEVIKFFGDHETIVEIDPLGNSGLSNSFKTSNPTNSPSISPTPSPTITNNKNALNGSESFDGDLYFDASPSTNNSDYNSDNSLDFHDFQKFQNGIGNNNSLDFHDFQKFQNGMENNLLETDLGNGLEITSTNYDTTSIQQETPSSTNVLAVQVSFLVALYAVINRWRDNRNKSNKESAPSSSTEPIAEINLANGTPVKGNEI